MNALGGSKAKRNVSICRIYRTHGQTRLAQAQKAHHEEGGNFRAALLRSHALGREVVDAGFGFHGLAVRVD
jgi:hypothetical protein